MAMAAREGGAPRMAISRRRLLTQPAGLHAFALRQRCGHGAMTPAAGRQWGGHGQRPSAADGHAAADALAVFMATDTAIGLPPEMRQPADTASEFLRGSGSPARNGASERPRGYPATTPRRHAEALSTRFFRDPKCHAPCGHAPSMIRRAVANTSTSMGMVRRPVKVFC